MNTEDVIILVVGVFAGYYVAAHYLVTRKAF